MKKDKEAKLNIKEKSKGLYPDELVKPIKEHLLSRLFGLERQKKEISAADPFNDLSRLDDNAAIDDDAAEQTGHDEVFAIKTTLDRSIIQVRKALTMIKVGKYGMCERCGKMIDTDRLMIMPETTVCISCERKKEK